MKTDKSTTLIVGMKRKHHSRYVKCCFNQVQLNCFMGSIKKKKSLKQRETWTVDACISKTIYVLFGIEAPLACEQIQQKE